jgi:hypothetical protein
MRGYDLETVILSGEELEKRGLEDVRGDLQNWSI